MNCAKCDRFMEEDESVYQKVIQESIVPLSGNEPDTWSETECGWICEDCAMGEL